MSNKELFSSYRWKEAPIARVIGHGKPQTKEESIESKKTLLKILVEGKELTQEEADKRLQDFIDSLN